MAAYEIEGVEVVIRRALTAAVADVLVDGYLFSTRANMGDVSGTLKHFFDGINTPCLATCGDPQLGVDTHYRMYAATVLRGDGGCHDGCPCRA